ncbi:hypothetical protein BDP27DRAFT_1400351 [Rhodocollybia butyracea]|uniref:Uncharacterized protein n=1 Tax=Rhodocollybia butyracea TaxID=206335 RepID=A0A9P5UBK8_9AGAR|nr:hypothetical protein BDP27DRAFT_1400351 [Rhodocollybia butyracea]
MIDDNPILLQSILRSDWERLLNVLMHKTYLDPPLDFKMVDWISVLKLSTLWEMDVIRAIAIKKIDRLNLDNPARKVNLAREYKIPDYCLPSLSQLIMRSASLSFQDLKWLGPECALNVASIRERINHDWKGSSKSTNVFLDQRRTLVCENVREDVDRAILSVFKGQEEYLY